MTAAELIATLQELDPGCRVDVECPRSLRFDEPGDRHAIGHRYGYIVQSGEIRHMTNRA